MKKQKSTNFNGITLIALVVTIVVLLILAGVSISMLTGENGIIKQAVGAKDKTKIGEEKEQVSLAVNASRENGYGAIIKSKLEEEILNLTGGKATVTGDGPFIIKYNDSGRSYTVDTNGTITEAGGGNGPTEPPTLADLITSQNPVSGNTTITDDNGDTITIPDGFNVSTDSPTNVVEGIVVEDRVDNQYVWIPVFEKNASRDWGVDYSAVTTAKTAANSAFTDTDFSNIETALKTYTATYASSSYKDEWYGDKNYGQYGYYNGSEFIYYTNGNMTEADYNNLYHNMLVSVYKNGGFYIGRYEMGTGVATDTATAQNLTRTSMSEYTASSDTNTSTTVRTDAAPSIYGMPTPVSKANAVGYTWITQSQAQMLARKIGQENEYGTTTSSLMFGVQLEAVCVFIEKYDTNNTATTKSDWLTNNTYSKLWGNYNNSTFTMDRGYYNIYTSSSPYILPENWNDKTAKTSSNIWLCTTGASNQNSSLNIYDFAGNLYEFTLERYSDFKNRPCTTRGGSFINGGGGSAYLVGVSCTYNSSCFDSARPSLFL